LWFFVLGIKSEGGSLIAFFVGLCSKVGFFRDPWSELLRLFLETGDSSWKILSFTGEDGDSPFRFTGEYGESRLTGDGLWELIESSSFFGCLLLM